VQSRASPRPSPASPHRFPHRQSPWRQRGPPGGEMTRGERRSHMQIDLALVKNTVATTACLSAPRFTATVWVQWVNAFQLQTIYSRYSLGEGGSCLRLECLTAAARRLPSRRQVAESAHACHSLIYSVEYLSLGKGQRVLPFRRWVSMQMAVYRSEFLNTFKYWIALSDHFLIYSSEPFNKKMADGIYIIHCVTIYCINCSVSGIGCPRCIYLFWFCYCLYG
jgi:hypothetical protein